eukprot:5487989-Prymnesium_polylepis.1
MELGGRSSTAQPLAIFCPGVTGCCTENGGLGAPPLAIVWPDAAGASDAGGPGPAMLSRHASREPPPVSSGLEDGQRWVAARTRSSASGRSRRPFWGTLRAERTSCDRRQRSRASGTALGSPACRPRWAGEGGGRRRMIRASRGVALRQKLLRVWGRTRAQECLVSCAALSLHERARWPPAGPSAALARTKTKRLKPPTSAFTNFLKKNGHGPETDAKKARNASVTAPSMSLLGHLGGHNGWHKSPDLEAEIPRLAPTTTTTGGAPAAATMGGAPARPLRRELWAFTVCLVRARSARVGVGPQRPPRRLPRQTGTHCLDGLGVSECGRVPLDGASERAGGNVGAHRLPPALEAVIHVANRRARA